MGRNDIRLRRNMISSGRISRHRNYSEVMRQHDSQTKMKRVFRVFAYFLVALFFILILIIVLRWEKKQSGTSKESTQGELLHTNSIINHTV